MKKLFASNRWVLVLSVILCVISIAGFIAQANGGPSIFVNGKLISMPSYIQDGVTYIPLRAVSENLGADVSWNQDQYAAYVTLASEGSIPNVIANISPSVVAIAGNFRTSYQSSQYNDAIGHGAGVVIKSGGEILTNAHVVKDMENITVILNDASSYRGKVKYIDEASDLAVVKIDKLGLKPIDFATSADIVAGRTVVAIGTPLSLTLRNSASAGIISGLNRGTDSDYGLIQTDAAINPGNSGGPLVDLTGRLIGINSSKYAGVGIEGMGFSIPIDTVNYVLSQFEAYGKVRRPDIGVKFEETWEAKKGLPTNQGLSIKSVNSGSPAAAAGILDGDMIMKIGSQMIHSLVDWNEAVKMVPVDGSINMVIQRGNGTLDITVNPNFN